VLTLTAAVFAHMARMTRAALLSVLTLAICRNGDSEGRDSLASRISPCTGKRDRTDR
jgi:hypothetical protein